MSARQPFMPFRPASRAAVGHDLNDSQTLTSSSHDDNVSSPLLTRTKSLGKDSSQPLQNVEPENTKRHLNLAGLMPSKSKSLQALKVRKAKTVNDHPQSPTNSWPASKKTLQIAASGSSSPFFTSSATGHITVTTFGDNSNLPVAEPTPTRPAHDSNALSIAYFPELPSFKPRFRSSHSLEKISEASEDESHHGEHNCNVNSPYHDSYPTEASPRLRTFALSTTEHERDILENVSGGRILRRTTNKRPPQSDEDEDYGVTGLGKRFKSHEDHSDHGEQSSRHTTSAMHRSDAHADMNRWQDVVTQHKGGGTLCRILGPNADARAESRTDQYENARTRWAECSMEEWRAGAEELALKFSSIMDMIKDRMTAKVDAYSGFYTILDTHKTVLEGKNEELRQVQWSLVKDSGNAVHGGDLDE